MDFSLTTMFVLPPGNTLPATGSTENLAPKQFGVFTPTYTPKGSSGPTVPYIYLAQGRTENVPGVGSKRSDKISPKKLLSWYKVKSEPNARHQSTVVSEFHVKCGQQLTVTIRAHSNYIDTGFANGYTQSVTVEAPCCDCGSDPCSEIDPVNLQAMVDLLVERFAVSGPFMGSVLSHYIDVKRVGDEAEATLVIEGKPLDKDGRLASVNANPWEFDRLWYQVFVTKGAPTTQDYLTVDRCEQIATVTTPTQASFARGSSEEIYHLEKYYYSYQSPAFKSLVDNSDYNGAYESYVVDGLFYDTYYLKFTSLDEHGTWDNSLPQDSTVILAIPAGETGQLEELLNNFLGVTVTDYSGVAVVVGP